MRRLGLGEGRLCPHFGTKEKVGSCFFEDLGEDREICGRKSETHHHLIIMFILPLFSCFILSL